MIGRNWVLASLLVCSPWSMAEEFSFDLSEFEKKPYEIESFVEFKTEYQWLDEDSAGHYLRYSDNNDLI